MKQPKFKHLGENGFPHAQNIDVYKYENNIDYERFNYDQMKLTICSVPWDMGEAHIGNRTIDGVGNVVYFESKNARDNWFNSIPDTDCYRWTTKFKELHSDNSVTVPLPFDVVAEYNYVFVEYSMFANDNSLLEYETNAGVRKWCYFIRNVEFVAPNTSRLEIMPDNWQTFIYDFNLTGMILERGHAPMFAMQTDEYLKNPLQNCSYLLTEDVNFGELQKVTHTATTPLNSENMKACIVTSADILGDWSDNVPAPTINLIGGVPAPQIFCCDAGMLHYTLTTLTNERPQFKQTIQAIFFISSDFLSLGQTFTIGNHTCYIVNSKPTQTNKSLYSFSKSDWGYSENYKNLAKLYTYPYSALEVVDEEGDATLIKIEDTNANLSIDVVANLVFPALNLQSVIKGVGGGNEVSVRFRNATEKSFKTTGCWYKLVKDWKIPTFSVFIDAYSDYLVNNRVLLDQRKTDAEVAKRIAYRNANNAKTISYRSAETGKTNQQTEATSVRDNSNRSASTSKTNSDAQATTARENAYTVASASRNCEYAGANNTVDNASAQTACNETNLTKGVEASVSDCNLSNSLAQALQAWDAGYTRNTTNAENDASIQSAAVSAAGSVVGGAVGGAISGASAGPVGAIAGALGGLVSGGISAATTGATTAIATNLATTQAELVIGNSQDKTTATTNNNNERTATANNAKIGQKDATNVMITTSAANTASTQKGNADTTYSATTSVASNTESMQKGCNANTYNTDISNATNIYDTSITTSNNTYDSSVKNADDSYNTAIANADDIYNNALAKIESDKKQAKLKAPIEYGSTANCSTATTKPQALYTNVITQSAGAIKQAGDEFLRYGYTLDAQWEFDGNWNVGKHFTYWKLRDYWVKANNFQDYYQDALRFFLMGGVTVWRKPEDIGSVSIYDNY